MLIVLSAFLSRQHASSRCDGKGFHLGNSHDGESIHLETRLLMNRIFFDSSNCCSNSFDTDGGCRGNVGLCYSRGESFIKIPRSYTNEVGEYGVTVTSELHAQAERRKVQKREEKAV